MMFYATEQLSDHLLVNIPILKLWGFIAAKLATPNYFAQKLSFTPDVGGHLFMRQLQMMPLL
jgi:hypothetical protein